MSTRPLSSSSSAGSLPLSGSSDSAFAAEGPSLQARTVSAADALSQFRLPADVRRDLPPLALPVSAPAPAPAADSPSLGARTADAAEALMQLSPSAGRPSTPLALPVSASVSAAGNPSASESEAVAGAVDPYSLPLAIPVTADNVPIPFTPPDGRPY